MPKVKDVEIRCARCKKWFSSPIMFGGTESFDTATLIGNLVQCRHCGQMTGCNKKNMRVQYEDGGLIGDETA